MNSVVRNQATGLDVVLLREPLGASAEVHLYGGQVTSWRNDRGEEMLFVSSKETFKPPKPIRGGIPICFPQFSNVGALERHGFARNVTWSIDPDAPPILSSNGSVSGPVNPLSTVDLILTATPEHDAKLWSYSFELRMRIKLKRGGNLTQTVRVRNIDNKPFSFTFAMGNYIRVSDVSEVRIEGLETQDFLDNLQERKRFTEQADSITFDDEVDRVYVDTPNSVSIIDHETKRIIVVKKEGLPDTVVWNPWDKKTKALTDLLDGEYTQMVCVEPAAIEKAIVLKPGEEWKGRQELSAGYWTSDSEVAAPPSEPAGINAEETNNTQETNSTAVPFVPPGATSL